MDTICWGLDSVFIYTEDNRSGQQGYSVLQLHLHQQFPYLQEHGLVSNLVKFQFDRIAINFLGHCITQNGSMPLPNKVKAIVHFKQPVMIEDLQEFVGMVDFYC